MLLPSAPSDDVTAVAAGRGSCHCDPYPLRQPPASRAGTRPTARRPSRPRCSPLLIQPAPSNDVTAVAAVRSRCCCCSCRLRPRLRRLLPASRTATPIRQRDGRAAHAALRCCSCRASHDAMGVPAAATAAAAEPSLAVPAGSQSHTPPAPTRPGRPRRSPLPLPSVSSDDATAVAAVCGFRCCCCSWHCDSHSQPQPTDGEAAVPLSLRSAAAPPNDAPAVAAECGSRCCCCSCHCVSHSQHQPGPASRTATPTQ